MSTPKPAKTKESSSVKFSNKTGGAYAEMKDVIKSERQNWQESVRASRVGDKDKQGSIKKD